MTETISPGLPTDTSTEVTAVTSRARVLKARGVPVLAVPVGFGCATTGGTRSTVYQVSSDQDNEERGTLRWALTQAGPKWITFEGDMSIALERPLQVGSDTTLDGRGRKVTLAGGPKVAGLLIEQVENVIVESLTLTDFGDRDLTGANDPHDAISVKQASRVWIDHCDLSLAADKALGISGTSEVTVSWNHFHDQYQTFQIGNMTTANDDVNNTVTVMLNWFDHCGYRQPVVSYGKAHVLNNYYREWGQYAVRSQRLAQVYLENNVFQPGEKTQATLIRPASDGTNDSGSLQDDRNGYLYETGNLYLEKCRHPNTGTEHMFNPNKAYTYTALEASQELVEVITAGAGPV